MMPIYFRVPEEFVRQIVEIRRVEIKLQKASGLNERPGMPRVSSSSCESDMALAGDGEMAEDFASASPCVANPE